MKKIIIIGSPGAGKSTFAQKLSGITNIPLYHLDLLYHKEDKTTISKDEFDNRLIKILKGNEWIIDGNYQRTLEMRLKACDTIFLLDYSTDVCLSGAKDRIGIKRSDLPWLEEKLDKEFEQQIINFSRDKLPKIYELFYKYKDKKNIIIFKTREDANNYIQLLKTKNISDISSSDYMV